MEPLFKAPHVLELHKTMGHAQDLQPEDAQSQLAALCPALPLTKKVLLRKEGTPGYCERIKK